MLTPHSIAVFGRRHDISYAQWVGRWPLTFPCPLALHTRAGHQCGHAVTRGSNLVRTLTYTYTSLGYDPRPLLHSYQS